MKNQNNIQSLIYKNYLTSSLIPIFIIGLILFILYLVVNYYMSEKYKETMLENAIINLQGITSYEANKISYELKEVSNYSKMIQREHVSFFSNLNNCIIENNKAKFGFHKNGVYYKINDNGGSSLYYSSDTIIGNTQKQKASCSEVLDLQMKLYVNSNIIITQAYLNTWDNMCRIYPYHPNLPKQLGSILDVKNHNFYYEADAKHNPERKPVWTSAYLDPAGQGWMISNIVPIYNNNFLEGVSGLDVTIESFVKKMLNIQLPWDSSSFMVDKNGMILAMQSKIEKLLKLKELKSHKYLKKVSETIVKPEEFNLLFSKNDTIKKQIGKIFKSKKHISNLEIDNINYLVSQEIVTQTDWRLITLIKEDDIFYKINYLENLNSQIAYITIIFMTIVYTIILIIFIRRTRTLSYKLAQPIKLLSRLTQQLGKSFENTKLKNVNIIEIDRLSHNFNEMIVELNDRTNALVESQLREKLKEQEAKRLEQLVVTDHLTGLYNRHKIDNALEEETERSKRLKYPFGIVLLDIDHFKMVNDTYGHQTGDEVLISFANILKLYSRKYDIVGRWGGEEFLIICTNTDKDKMIKVAENLRKIIEEYQFPVIKTKTSSFGVTLYRDKDEVKDIIARADKALYIAKKNGRNRVEFL